jgi:hypothetical protein
LIAAALDAGAPCAWVLADALCGSDARLRRMLEQRGQPYVLAVRANALDEINACLLMGSLPPLTHPEAIAHVIQVA